MNKLYNEIKLTLQHSANNPNNCTTSRMSGSNYSGSLRKSLHLKNPVKYKILANWAKQHKDISYKQLISVLDNLNQSEYIDEVTSMGCILQKFNKYRLNLDLSKLDQWVGHLQGWAEIDSLCQSTFDKKMT